MSIRETITNLTIQGVIAILIVVIGFLFLAYVPANESIKTTVANMMIMVIGYYFGSSRSTAKKDETIASMVDKNN